MSQLMGWMWGRLPIGWLQLMHNRTRLIAAVGGVTFANVLIFMQLGFMNALFETSVFSHRSFDADIVVVSSDFRALREASSLPSQECTKPWRFRGFSLPHQFTWAPGSGRILSQAIPLTFVSPVSTRMLVCLLIRFFRQGWSTACARHCDRRSTYSRFQSGNSRQVAKWRVDPS